MKKVIAKASVYYGNKLHKAGEEFFIADEKDFSERFMKSSDKKEAVKKEEPVVAKSSKGKSKDVI